METPVRRVLFVCHANIIRSPAAEWITRIKTAGSGLEVSSAGLISPPYTTISSEMNSALMKLGYPSFMEHKPRQITSELLSELLEEDQNLVLCFEGSQVEQLTSLAGNKSLRIHTLPEFAGFPSKDVPDPNDLIQDTFFSRFAASMPIHSLSSGMYNLLGHVHPSDRLAVNGIYLKTAMEIASYVDEVVKRIL